MLVKGIIGEVDGTKIMRVASGKLPHGCAFMITHPMACVAPKQLEDYRVSENPPGISGYLIEGRFIYDAFILNEKAKAIYYHGSQSKFRMVQIMTSATASGKTTVLINPFKKAASANKWYYMTASAASSLTSVTFGTAITAANWTELTAAATEITPTSGHKYIRVVEVDSADKPVSLGDGILNIG